MMNKHLVAAVQQNDSSELKTYIGLESYCERGYTKVKATNLKRHAMLRPSMQQILVAFSFRVAIDEKASTCVPCYRPTNDGYVVFIVVVVHHDSIPELERRHCSPCF